MAEADVHCIFPSQVEIDDGFVFGRSFKFEMSMGMVRRRALETTNQRILNEDNAWKIYTRLCGGEINDSTWLTLSLVLFTSPFELQNGTGCNLYFKEGKSTANFLATLSTMPRESMEEKWAAMLPNIL